MWDAGRASPAAGRLGVMARCVCMDSKACVVWVELQRQRQQRLCCDIAVVDDVCNQQRPLAEVSGVPQPAAGAEHGLQSPLLGTALLLRCGGAMAAAAMLLLATAQVCSMSTSIAAVLYERSCRHQLLHPTF